MRRTMKKAVAVGLAAATAFSLCACGGGDGSKGSSKDALEVVIWDNNQQKGLQQICDLFTEETGIKVDVQVKEWDSYWTLLEAGASGGDMPDVFWMHSNNSQMYMKNNKLLKLDDYIEKSDKVDMSNYMSEITELQRITIQSLSGKTRRCLMMQDFLIQMRHGHGMTSMMQLRSLLMAISTVSV